MGESIKGYDQWNAFARTSMGVTFGIALEEERRAWLDTKISFAEMEASRNMRVAMVPAG